VIHGLRLPVIAFWSSEVLNPEAESGAFAFFAFRFNKRRTVSLTTGRGSTQYTLL
jgi:hypothetical protein